MKQQSEVLAGCEVEWSAGWIKVTGEIDVANAPVIELRIRALLEAGDVVVDCGPVTFVDVAALRMLARVGNAAAAVSTVVRLRCSPVITETLALFDPCELPGMVLDRDDFDSPGSLR